MSEEKSITKHEQSSYRNIFKTTSLFGGVEIWKILIGIIKQKLIAMLIGPTGMGISGLYTSSTQLIKSISSMGLSSSAVKNVAEANGSGDQKRIGRVIKTMRRLVWITGLVGMAIVIILSPSLSTSAFGNTAYIIPFILLSVTLLLDQLSAGQSVLLQGMRKLKYLAKAGVYGSLVSLVFTIPIYYFLRLEGIVPTLILNSLIMLVFTWSFSKKIQIEDVDLPLRETFNVGKEMLSMGIFLTLNSILAYGISYVVRVYISRVGGVDEVGLYTAGMTLVSHYTAMVFTAMATDYYPKLAEVNKDNEKCKLLINQQAEVATLLMAPLAIVFLVAAPLIIKILYTSKFLPIIVYIQLSMIGMLFKAGSWSISYVYLAKSDMKTFIVTEVSSKIIQLGLYLLLYWKLGLNGLGLAFLLSFVVYTIIVYYTARLKYGFRFSQDYLKLMLLCLPMFVLAFALLFFCRSPLTYIPTIAIAAFICYYSLKELNDRVGLLALVHKYTKKSK